MVEKKTDRWFNILKEGRGETVVIPKGMTLEEAVEKGIIPKGKKGKMVGGKKGKRTWFFTP